MLFPSSETSSCGSLVSLRRKNALENVQRAITEQVSWIILNELSDTDYQWYSEIEKQRMRELSLKVSDLAANEVVPAVLSYLSRHFPERMRNPDTEWAPGLKNNLSIDITHAPTSKSMISDGERISSSSRLAGFYFYNIDKSRKVRLYLNDILEDFIDDSLEEEALFDFLFQILLHEILHSSSVVSYMTHEEECAERRAVALRESIIGSRPVDWQEMAYRVGYAYNFVNSTTDVRVWEISYQTLPKAVSFNEGLTDILSAKIYAEYATEKYGVSHPGYKVSYKKEARQIYHAIREFAKNSGMRQKDVFQAVEEWFFFYDPDETGFIKYVQPMMRYYEI